MKKIVLALAGMFALAALVVTSCLSCSPQQVNKKAQPQTFFTNTVSQPPAYYFLDSIGMVFAEPGKKGSTGISGTAFAITKDLLLTAGHVCFKIEEKTSEGLVGGISIGLTEGHGLPAGMIKAEIVTYRPNPDLCLLYSKSHGMSVLPISQRYKSVRSGDHVIVPGAPSGFFPVTRYGTVSSLFAYQHRPDLKNLLLLNVVIEGGNSGSPVIWNNEVIGLVTMLPSYPKTSALAVTSLSILDFLEEALIEEE